ncbi:helicase-related protein [Brucella abortus]|nr:helicase-related protein [Brucella abortus]
MHRQRALNGFRDGTLRILVATDIAARGIDVPGISHVVNYDLPDEPETYVHRIGRNGASGASITLYDPATEESKLRAVERVTRSKLSIKDAPVKLAPAPVAKGPAPQGQRTEQAESRKAPAHSIAAPHRRRASSIAPGHMPAPVRPRRSRSVPSAAMAASAPPDPKAKHICEKPPYRAAFLFYASTGVSVCPLAWKIIPYLLEGQGASP